MQILKGNIFVSKYTIFTKHHVMYVRRADILTEIENRPPQPMKVHYQLQN